MLTPEERNYLQHLRSWAYQCLYLDQQQEDREGNEGQDLRQFMERIEQALRQSEYSADPQTTVSGEDLFSLYDEAQRFYDQRWGMYQEEFQPFLEGKEKKKDKKKVKQKDTQKKEDMSPSAEDEPATDADEIPLNPVPIGEHRLPPLPYAYDALEPYIDEETMRIHHQQLHQNYVDGLNEAEKQMARARQRDDYELLRHWEREAAFHGAGHYLHTIFWNVMHPQGGGEPTGELARQIEQDFGSFARFQRHFSEAAERVEGPGWAMLVWAPRAHRLEILAAEKHQLMSQQDQVPLLVLDVWEHAYFKKYGAERDEYIRNWWHVVNWDHVADRYRNARRLRWEPY